MTGTRQDTAFEKAGIGRATEIGDRNIPERWHGQQSRRLVEVAAHLVVAAVRQAAANAGVDDQDRDAVWDGHETDFEAPAVDQQRVPGHAGRR